LTEKEGKKKKGVPCGFRKIQTTPGGGEISLQLTYCGLHFQCVCVGFLQLFLQVALGLFKFLNLISGLGVGNKEEEDDELQSL